MDGPSPDEAGFLTWLAIRSRPLRRKAYLLTGSWHRADDLLQETLVATYATWPRVASMADPDAYVNRIMVNKLLDERRRPWRRERAVPTLPDGVDEAAGRAYDAIEGQDSPLSRALATLPAAQRAVLVLRYTDDLSVPEIARHLDLREGTVKSRLSRGTETLRRLLEPARRPEPTPPAGQSRTR